MVLGPALPRVHPERGLLSPEVVVEAVVEAAVWRIRLVSVLVQLGLVAPRQDVVS